MPENNKLIGVRVRLPLSSYQRIDEVAKLPIRTANSQHVPLSSLATLTQVQGQPEINRNNLNRMVAVTGRISGRSLGSAIVDVRKALAKKGLLPKGIRFELGAPTSSSSRHFAVS